MATKRHKKTQKVKNTIDVWFFFFCDFSCLFVAILRSLSPVHPLARRPTRDRHRRVRHPRRAVRLPGDERMSEVLLVVAGREVSPLVGAARLLPPQRAL